MDSNEVRGSLNAVLYGVMFQRELTDTAADELAVSLARDDRRDRFREAIGIAVRDGRLPAETAEFGRPHTEAELLAFLARVSARLDAEPPGAAG